MKKTATHNIRKIKPLIVARITTTRLPEDDLVLVAPEGETTGLGDEGVIWIVGGG
jgi:hypothetical protein